MNIGTAVFLGMFVITSYQSKMEQTDNTPYITATGYYAGPGGVAVHPELLCPRAKYKIGNKIKLCTRDNQCAWKDKVHYYDLVFIENIGFKFVNDRMAWKTAMGSRWDVWVKNYSQEKLHHSIYGTKELKVWIVQKVQREY